MNLLLYRGDELLYRRDGIIYRLEHVIFFLHKALMGCCSLLPTTLDALRLVSAGAYPDGCKWCIGICQIPDADLCNGQKVGEISFPGSQLLAKVTYRWHCGAGFDRRGQATAGSGWCIGVGGGGGEGRKMGRRVKHSRLLGADESKVVKLQWLSPEKHRYLQFLWKCNFHTLLLEVGANNFQIWGIFEIFFKFWVCFLTKSFQKIQIHHVFMKKPETSVIWKTRDHSRTKQGNLKFTGSRSTYRYMKCIWSWSCSVQFHFGVIGCTWDFSQLGHNDKR